MCKKLPYRNPKKDKCLIKFIDRINKYTPFKTLASCCGHNKYNPTMIIKDKNGNVFELFTRTPIQPKKRNRYYKSDGNGFYIIPELHPEIFN